MTAASRVRWRAPTPAKGTSCNVLLPVLAVLLLSTVLTTRLGVNLGSLTSRSIATAAPSSLSLSDRLQGVEREMRKRAATPGGASATSAAGAPNSSSVESAIANSSPARAGSLPPSSLSSFDGSFLVASEQPFVDAPTALRMLKSLLGLGRLLRRKVVLPASLCATAPGAPGAGAEDAPFGCRLHPKVRAELALERWRAGSAAHSDLWLSAPLVPTGLLSAAGSDELPRALARSHVRVLLPDGMSDSETRYALRSYTDTRILELERAAEAYCGWDPRHDKAGEGLRFEALVGPLFSRRSPVLHACEHFHGGAGEVQRFTNLGTLGDTHAVSAPYQTLPASVRRLPNGSDLVITFATGSVSTMALNWAATAQRAGVADILIGALDEAMMRACAAAQQPCVLIQGGAISAELTSNSHQTNLRSRPSLYPKMSVLKVGFYRELLSYGFNVWACDADAVLVGDPRPLMRRPEWIDADVAAATDCIDIPLDNRRPLLHCDLNTGLVFMRSTPKVLRFVLRWRETIASAKELRIRDQVASPAAACPLLAPAFLPAFVPALMPAFVPLPLPRGHSYLT